MFGSGQAFVLFTLQDMSHGFLHTVGDFIQDGGNLGDHTVTLFFTQDVHLIVYTITERQHIVFLQQEKYISQEDILLHYLFKIDEEER